MNERISINPAICSGRPVIRGTRVPVAQIVSAIAGGDTIEETIEQYPHITKDDVLACLNYAAGLVDHVRIYRSSNGEKVVLPANLVSGVVKPPRHIHKRLKPRLRPAPRYGHEPAQAA